MALCYECARRGEPRAVESVAGALRARIERMAAHYARRSAQDADDLQQEAWLGVLEALPDLDVTIGVPEGFLLQRARWRLLDSLRRSRRAAALTLDEVGEVAAAHDEGRGIDERLVVMDFVRGLPEVQRAIVACLVAGYSWRETGKALGCTSANVAYHMRGIRKRYAAHFGAGDGATAHVGGEPAATTPRSSRPSARRPRASP
ncbi:MAG: sigma-70 family RNA polymerase sigma factor [Chthonomonadales bacterium]|nr:sigma-70 family RNA polymerase sigma factor [Chthonomonadales bacterium]